MNALLERWKALLPREQWLTALVVLLVPSMLSLSLIHEPLVASRQRLQAEHQTTVQRRQEARLALAELQARAANQPDLALRNALADAVRRRDLQHQQLAQGTAGLIRPQTMQQVLQDLLQRRPGLQLLKLESFSEPVAMPAETVASEVLRGADVQALRLYRHGVRVTLEGSYFELRDYLQAIEASGRHLFWERLDYQVGEAGPGRARIELELFTLGQAEGWIGV